MALRGHNSFHRNTTFNRKNIMTATTIVKIEDLFGEQLDYAVAVCSGWDSYDVHSNGKFELENSQTGECRWLSSFRPSSDWAVGGPFIGEIEGLTQKTELTYNNPAEKCMAWIYNSDGSFTAFGPTPLNAAMKAYVSWKSKVAGKSDLLFEIPNELV
jgi:hypothetical protein